MRGIEKYNGRMYNVYTLRKVQLYPLQAGTVAIDPLVAKNKVTFYKIGLCQLAKQRSVL